MRYDATLLQEINDNVDLYEYASDSLKFEIKNGNAFTHCTKHTDLTPSLSISLDDNFFYCFSCGRGGKIISWLMEYEGMTFDEAVRKGMKLANINQSTLCQSETVKFIRNIKHNATKDVEHIILPNNIMDTYKTDTIAEWLNEGIRQEEINLFDIRIDEKSNRIVYPVKLLDGSIINIKGRTRYTDYKAMKIPKYINYYKVDTVDYFQGLNLTIEYVKEKKEIIIFEGLKSVMKCFGYGSKNTASAEKHTLTDEQIKLLLQIQVDVVLAFDNDVSYFSKEIKQSIDILKKFTNVYIVSDKNKLLGKPEDKMSPVDAGKIVWDQLYREKVLIR
jgi:DNA primase